MRLSRTVKKDPKDANDQSDSGNRKPDAQERTNFLAANLNMDRPRPDLKITFPTVFNPNRKFQVSVL
jgi:hypothetical protein